MNLKDSTHLATAFSAAAATLLYLMWRAFRRFQETKKPFADLPMPKDTHWLHGHALSLFQRDFQKGLKHLTVDSANEYGQTGLWLGAQPVLSVADWRDARAILMTENSRHLGGMFNHYLKGTLGTKNVLLLNGKEWKSHRDAITRTFGESFMMESRRAMKETTEDLVKALKKKKLSNSGSMEFDIQPLMKMITIDVFGKAAFDMDLGCCSNLLPSKLARAFDFVVQEFSRRLNDPLNPLNFFYWIPTQANLQYHKEKQLIRSFVLDLITQKKKTDNGMLSRLLRGHEGELYNEASFATLIDVMMSILFAGYGK